MLPLPVTQVCKYFIINRPRFLGSFVIITPAHLFLCRYKCASVMIILVVFYTFFFDCLSLHFYIILAHNSFQGEPNAVLGGEKGFNTLCEDLLWLKEKDDKLTADMNLRDFGEDESAAAMTQFLLQRKAKYHASCRSKFHDKRRKLSSKVSDNCPSQHLTHPHQDPSCLLSTTPTRSQETTPHRQNATHSTPTSSRRMPWSFASTPDIGLTPDIGQSVTVSVTLRLGYRMLTRLVDHSEGLSGTGCCGC